MKHLWGIKDGNRSIKEFDTPIVVEHEREVKLVADPTDRNVRVALWQGERKLYEAVFPLHQISAYGMHLSLDWQDWQE